MELTKQGWSTTIGDFWDFVSCSLYCWLLCMAQGFHVHTRRSEHSVHSQENRSRSLVCTCTWYSGSGCSLFPLLNHALHRRVCIFCIYQHNGSCPCTPSLLCMGRRLVYPHSFCSPQLFFYQVGMVDSKMGLLDIILLSSFYQFHEPASSALNSRRCY